MCRPTKYKKKFCEEVIELGKTGASIVQMATAIGVVKSTLWEWEKIHDEFSNALTRAREESQSWWEKQGQEGLWETHTTDKESGITQSRKMNGGVWSRSMAARFPEDWRETRHNENNNNTKITMADELKKALLNDESNGDS